MIDEQLLSSIQKDVVATIQPTWMTALPSNFGSPAHGKPKADEWRMAIFFAVTVAILKRWMTPKASPRHQKAALSTMLLATAIDYATLYTMNMELADSYTRFMQAYLETVRELWPGMNLRPTHHYALHYGEFLKHFGPSHGWWMFPFERMIGMLQKIKHNDHDGTMNRSPWMLVHVIPQVRSKKP